MVGNPVTFRPESAEQLERLNLLCELRGETVADFVRRHIEQEWAEYGEVALEAKEAMQRVREKAGLG